MGYINHAEPYSDDYLKDILSSVKTIAMVGASPDKTKFSYGVLRVLSETGYDMIPINPRPGLEEIRGLKVYPSLKRRWPSVQKSCGDRLVFTMKMLRASPKMPACGW